MRTTLLVAVLAAFVVFAASAQSARTVFVAGDVNKAGEYAFEEGLTAGEALKLAGSFTSKMLNSGNQRR
jgi:protein involved in polysaccharide export with SLBB domain